MKIVIIGAGNVASHLAKALFNANFEIVQILSRNIENSKALADIYKCKYSCDLNDLIKADLYLISVPDSEIKKIVSHQNLKNKFVVHTSGSIEMNILKLNSQKFGVFYPLQSFNKNKYVDFFSVPICLEASDDDSFEELNNIAKTISKNVYKINSEQRSKMHIAAVFVNNFVNHIFTLANKIVENEKVDIEILKPLISKTFENILNQNPSEIQTGPARRNDILIIEKHLSELKNYPQNFSEVYKAITESIISTYKN